MTEGIGIPGARPPCHTDVTGSLLAETEGVVCRLRGWAEAGWKPPRRVPVEAPRAGHGGGCTMAGLCRKLAEPLSPRPVLRLGQDRGQARPQQNLGNH